MNEKSSHTDLSFFKPRGATMRSEVRVITLVLSGWLVAIVGFQLFAYFLEISYSEILLKDLTFFNLPIQFWLSGQLLPLWFIILCVLFNIWMDRHSGQSLEGSLRFRIKPVTGEDE
jgi:putative solute:sodium symporter small subunit